MSIEKGALYVVATPIGNLADMGGRAVEVLGGVDRIAAEDTRHSRHLLQHFGIATPMVAYHEHNEREMAPRLLSQLQAGEALALISDAGTPLLSDPGFHLVRQAQEIGVRVIPVPGPSAAICALSVSGLPTDRFAFEGFLPAKTVARRARLERLMSEPRTLVFYESSHRIVESLNDLASIFGGDREAVVARELTKTFETVRRAPLAELAIWVASDPNQQRGEFVVLVRGAEAAESELDAELRRTLEVLLEALSPKQAAGLAARLTGAKRNRAYQLALSLAGKGA